MKVAINAEQISVRKTAGEEMTGVEWSAVESRVENSNKKDLISSDFYHVSLLRSEME